ncbi:MAG: prolipoprotein diacylglyceryl transferase [Clostridia bacterium]|nr:prolipoprotein diacylglyceryl transferase [Clostridia bacterium]
MFSWLSDLVIKVGDAGLAHLIFYSLHIISYIACIALAMYFGTKMNVKPFKCALMVLMGFSMCYGFMLLFFWVQSGFRIFGGQNISTVYIYFPLLYYLPAKLFKVDTAKYCSMLAAGTPLTQAIGHTGCVFLGCCGGYPAEWGVYNYLTKQTVVPNQLLEALVALAIAIYMFLRLKRRDFSPDFRDYPVMLILFGSTRFFLEFLRNNKKILFGCSAICFHMIFMVLVGVVWLVLCNKSEKKKSVVVASTID